ncbi:MAG TPA: M20/M25/M40 family metallo-hydrolase [Candidatus Limnocylindrales bacterium]|nr:M20/M25/M40 family metallo-hydrolase [Candidatus Limnocylindrales bacterium]
MISTRAAAQSSIETTYRAAADSLISAALKDSAAWNRLARLTDTFGHRLSGSRSLENAIDWALAEMKRDGLDNVRGEPAMVPHWVRGEESLTLVSPRNVPLRMLGLGGSVATPKKGITAPVMIVGSFDELTQRAAEAKGKIVLFNVPFTTYGQTVAYRVGGASAAAKVGAVAALVRSVTPMSLRTPHTGVMRYDTTIAKIPTAAITVEDALMFKRMADRGDKVVVTLKMNAQTLPLSPSRNVVAEVRGSEKPDEVVLISGHYDSWDVGQGAMDDGGGAVAAWEAVRLIKHLGLKPRRTVRVVLWTNEENGTAGGRAYLDAHRADVAKHVLAIESDNGVFKPRGVALTGTDSATATVRRIAKLLDRIGAGSVASGGGGSDIGPLMELGVAGMSPDVDETKYFWYHHTDADTMDKLDPHDVALCVATMAVMAYVVADLPDALPHGPATEPER